MMTSVFLVGVSSGLLFVGQAQAQGGDSAEPEASVRKVSSPRLSNPPNESVSGESLPSEGDKDHSMVEIVVNPITLLQGAYAAEVGLALSDSLSVNATAAYIDSNSGDLEVTAYSVGIGLQRYFSGRTYAGWYLYPSVTYLSATGVAPGVEVNVSALSWSLTGGYQWDWKPFTLRLGAGFLSFEQIAENGNADVGYDRTRPVLDASLGVTF